MSLRAKIRDSSIYTTGNTAALRQHSLYFLGAFMPIHFSLNPSAARSAELLT